MSLRNTFGIYHVIERLLKDSDRPLTCVDLFDSAEIKEFAADANRVSDYLGHMYRRKLLGRIDAPKTDNSMARYAYYWKDAKRGAPAQRNVQPRLTSVPTLPPPAASPDGLRQTIYAKPGITIEEAGKLVTIALPGFTVKIITE